MDTWDKKHADGYTILRANGFIVVYCPEHSPRYVDMGQGITRDTWACRKRRDDLENRSR